jgi:hypothetical protein
MNIQDAANLLGISNGITPEITKEAFRRAAMKFHPDRNSAGLEMMQAINAAYQVLREFNGVVGEANGYDDLLSDAINGVRTCPGVVVEVCGNWVWLSGNTKEFKAIIKDVGFKWASKKGMWYFRPDEWKSSNRRQNSIEEIRNLHGSVKVNSKNVQMVDA